MMAKKKMQVFHPESPGIRIWVERGFWGRLLKPKDFATLGEALDHATDILSEISIAPPPEATTMSEYQKQCPIDGGTCGQGGTCYVCENEALGSELTAAKARIAELEKALEPFAEAYRHAEKRGATERHPHAFEEFRHAAALLKDK